MHALVPPPAHARRRAGDHVGRGNDGSDEEGEPQEGAHRSDHHADRVRNADRSGDHDLAATGRKRGQQFFVGRADDAGRREKHRRPSDSRDGSRDEGAATHGSDRGLRAGNGGGGRAHEGVQSLPRDMLADDRNELLPGCAKKVLRGANPDGRQLSIPNSAVFDGENKAHGAALKKMAPRKAAEFSAMVRNAIVRMAAHADLGLARGAADGVNPVLPSLALREESKELLRGTHRSGPLLIGDGSGLETENVPGNIAPKFLAWNNLTSCSGGPLNRRAVFSWESHIPREVRRDIASIVESEGGCEGRLTAENPRRAAQSVFFKLAVRCHRSRV